MKFVKHVAILAGVGLAGCLAQEGNHTMSNTAEEQQTVFAQILAENRARLAANTSALQSIGRTPCRDGYALEVFAPKAIRFAAALRQSTAKPEDAMFWVLRVPNTSPLAEVSVTVPNAWDKPDWFAERRVDERWTPVPKPASNGTAHASLVDAAATFRLADAQGDIVLPVSLAGPLSRLMVNPELGLYRIHFAPFTATIGGEVCSFDAGPWEVTLR